MFNINYVKIIKIIIYNLKFINHLLINHLHYYHHILTMVIYIIIFKIYYYYYPYLIIQIHIMQIKNILILFTLKFII